MPRIGEDLVRRTFLDDAARVHHGQPVAVGSEDRQVVTDDDHADTALLHQAADQVEDLSLDHHVQRGGRLVGHDEVRLAGQRHGDHDALLLAAR